MKRFITASGLIVFIIGTLLTFGVDSDVTPPDPIKNEEIISGARETFVQIRHSCDLKVCKIKKKKKKKKKKKRKKKKVCITKNGATSASGFAIGTDDHGTFIMTAAHACSPDYLIERTLLSAMEAGMPLSEDDDVYFSVDLETIGLSGKVSSAVVIGLDKKNDMCVIYAEGLYMQTIGTTVNRADIGAPVFNVAAPTGLFDVNMVPVFKGVYNGVLAVNDSERIKKLAVYSIPAAGGSSGSPILSITGRLVGMIVSVNSDFDSISYSPTATTMNRFFNRVIKKTRQCILIR